MAELDDRAVVDASVAVKWVVTEIDSESAERVNGLGQLLAPAHLPIEVANAIWKKHRAGELPLLTAHEALSATLQFPIDYIESQELLIAAFSLATLHDRTIYDSLYLALALREECPLVTADRRFYNAMFQSHPRTMLWVGDIPNV